MNKRFTQKQALAMYSRLKEVEAWLEYHARIVGTDCEESDRLRGIRDTLKGIETK